jgi:hypothetical protein
MQQYFKERREGRVVLRNMIGREVLKGSYRWNWSVTTGSSFTAAESYRFAEESRGPVVQRGTGLTVFSRSWVSVSDPAFVIFHLDRESKRLNVWLTNYCEERRQGELSFAVPFRACHRVNFEGKPMTEMPVTVEQSTKRVKLSLSPWEMAALEVELE